MNDHPIKNNSINISDYKSSVRKIIKRLLSFYDLNIDIEGVLSETAYRENEDEISYIERFFKKIGFSVEKENVSLLQVGKVKTPLVFKYKNQDLVLVMPPKAFVDSDHIFCEEDSLKECVLREGISGQAVYLSLAQSDIRAYADHMQKGHALDWFWRPIREYSTSYYEILVASLFINCLVLAIPLFSLNVYDRIIVNFAQETLIVLTIGVIFALVFDFFFKTVRSYILERVAEDLGNDYDFQLMERLLDIKVGNMPISIGEQANMFREMNSIRDFYATRLVPTLVDLPFILLFILIIYYLSPVLAFVPISVAIIILVGNFAIGMPINRTTKAYFSAIQNKSSFLIETLAGLSVVKMFGAHSNRLFQWDCTVTESGRVTRFNAFLMSIISNLTFTASQICHVLIIFLGVYQIQENNLTIGGLITCTILSSRAIAPIMGLSSLLVRFNQSNDVLEAIDKFFKLPHEGKDTSYRSSKGPFQGNVSLKNVSYQYPAQERPALQSVNLDVLAGQNIGIIGKTAAGKSTLAKIIAGIIDPSQGELTLDNIIYKAIPSTEMRRSIAYAPQDSFFFRGSILYNITLGRENINKQMLETAISVSGLDLVIQQNAEGLDMDVGEQGTRLSGGQKQAISLARAIICNPQVLIFDEPTTGMDTALEKHVQVQLKRYVEDRTFIMITHRTSLLSLVNRLVLIDGGRIIADGERDDILRKLSGGGANE